MRGIAWARARAGGDSMGEAGSRTTQAEAQKIKITVENGGGIAKYISCTTRGSDPCMYINGEDACTSSCARSREGHNNRDGGGG